MFIVSTMLLNPTIPVQFMFSFPETDSVTKVHLLYTNQILTASELATYALALFLIISGYIVRIQKLYFSKDPRGELSYVVSWLIWSIITINGPINLKHVKVYENYQKSSRDETLQRIKDGSRISYLILSAFYRYQGSFLSSLSTIVFSFTYGIAQVVVYRWKSNVELTHEASDMGFGQVMALFLLCLPFLVAGETYYGESSSLTKSITA
jgi:hypothetical protein